MMSRTESQCDQMEAPSPWRSFSLKASTYHARIPYVQRLPFPAIAIILILIAVNLIVWAAVGIVLVSATCDSAKHIALTIAASIGIRHLYLQLFCPILWAFVTLWMRITSPPLTS